MEVGSEQQFLTSFPVDPVDCVDPLDPAEAVAGAAARSPPCIRAGSLDDVS